MTETLYLCGACDLGEHQMCFKTRPFFDDSSLSFDCRCLKCWHWFEHEHSDKLGDP